jgi:hypothetical protein
MAKIKRWLLPSRSRGLSALFQQQELFMTPIGRISLAITIAALLAVPSVQATVIDHNAVNAVSGYSQSTMDQIGGVSYMFSHASVGGNMMSGLDSLHASNANFYQLQTVDASSTPPASVLAGNVYGIDRGNPAWSAKLSAFDGYLANGWAGAVNLAMDKFCYIDQNANASDYLSFMQGLEANYASSGTRLVYATIPLTTGSDSSNILRNNFNNAVRSFVAGSSSRLLFDVADIEAWDTHGVQHTFVSGGHTYQMLYSGYSSDGGHLNGLGSERVALGFYGVANASLAPIPEPETYAMMLAGLGLLGAIGRRRRQPV